MSSARGGKHNCQLCGFQTNLKTHLLLHKLAVHEGKQFQCLECQYQASYKSELITHQKSAHMGQKIKCPECEYQASEVRSYGTKVEISRVLISGNSEK